MNGFAAGFYYLNMKKGCCISHCVFDLNIFVHTIIYFGIGKMLFGIFKDMFDLRSVSHQRMYYENHSSSKVGAINLFSFNFFSHLLRQSFILFDFRIVLANLSL